MRWLADWQPFERGARAMREAVAGIEPDDPPTPQDVIDQLDLVRWLRLMLDIDGDIERY